MDAQQFLAEFGHIANAPNGIVQLRKMIYQLAITGMLTVRSERTEDARALLANIEVARQELIRKKKYKRMPKLESESLRAPSGVVLPLNWCWTRLLDVGEISPRNEADDDELAAFVPMSGIPQMHRGSVVSDAIKWGDIKKGYTHVANGDVVIAKITPCFENGKAAVISDLKVASGLGAGTTELHVFRPFHEGILSAYVYLFLRSPYFVIDGEKNMIGTAGQKRLPNDYFATRAFPLPPTEEQSRIVGKVDNLMALCDTLEGRHEQRRSVQNALRQATLITVATATSPHELETSWARLADNFSLLFEAREDAKALRDVICDLALRGLFLPGVLKDTGASIPDRPPLPVGWGWDTLGNFSEYITSGSRGWKNYLSASGDAFIRSQDISQDALIFDNPVYVTLPAKAEGKRTLVRQGDLLLTITGGNVGKCARVPALDFKAYVSQHVALIRLRDSSLAEFIHFWMINAYGGRNFLARYIYGDKPGLNLVQVGSVLIPVPPESVRTKILERLRRYQILCDRLAIQIDSGRKVATMLATAVTSALVK